MSSKLYLNNMPEVILDAIFSRVGFREIQVLRKVCRDFRNFIDDVIPKAPIDHLEIHMEDHRISGFYQYSEETHYVKYQKHENGCQVSYKSMKRVMDDISFIDAFMKDFGMILKHQKSIINVFKLLCRSRELEVADEIFEGLAKVLESRKRLLEVNEIQIEAHGPQHITNVLPYLDPKSLKSISFRDKLPRDKILLDVKEIVQLEQWKNAEEFYCSTFRIEGSLQQFLHFTHVSALFETVTVEDMVQLKEKFLQSPKIVDFEFKYTNFENGRHFWDSLGPFYFSRFGDFGAERWYYRIPNSDQFVQLHHNRATKFVWFDRINAEDVPKDAVVFS